MGLTHQTDHLDMMVSRLPLQFREVTQIQLRYEGIAQQVQELEDAAWDVFTLRSLADAEGEQLEVLGRLLKASRGSLDDTSYRNRLRAQILVFRKSGEVETLIQVVRLLAPPVVNPQVTEPSPATAFVDVVSGTVFDVPSLFAVLKRAKDAGVRLLLHSSGAPPAGTFTFNGTPGQGFNAGVWSTIDAG
jgi:hypothetical protein